MIIYNWSAGIFQAVETAGLTETNAGGGWSRQKKFKDEFEDEER